jgi:hypothetical protein
VTRSIDGWRPLCCGHDRTITVHVRDSAARSSVARTARQDVGPDSNPTSRGHDRETSGATRRRAILAWSLPEADREAVLGDLSEEFPSRAEELNLRSARQTTGLVGAAELATLIKAFLFEVQPHDVGVDALVALTLATAGLLAAWLPARRAATIDPLISIEN